MAAVLVCHTKKYKKAKAIFVSYQKERADLKMIHNENDVLIDDELVAVRGQLKNVKKCMLIYTK